jgi:hypothetical protein
MAQTPLYLFLAIIGCLYPELTEAAAIGWLLIVAARLT